MDNRVQYYNDFIKHLKFYVKKVQIPKDLNFFFFKGFCKSTQADKVLWHLENFGSITNLQCHAIYGIRHAPSVIRDLRQRLKFQGNKYKIENRTKKGGDRFGNAISWDEYVLISTGGEDEITAA